MGMCEICDGAKSTSEMPCSKVLTEFGKILYQVVGGCLRLKWLCKPQVVYIHHLRKGAKFPEISCMAFI